MDDAGRGAPLSDGPESNLPEGGDRGCDRFSLEHRDVDVDDAVGPHEVRGDPERRIERPGPLDLGH